MRKWAHIRDSWVKSMKYGYDEKTKRPPKPYVYHNELQFLLKILKTKPPKYDFSMSFLSNDELYGYRTETQISQNDLSYCENNGEDITCKDNSVDISEQVEEEIHTKSELPLDIENADERYGHSTDNENWPLNEVNITAGIEFQKDNETSTHDMNSTAKQTRSSIFIKTRDNNAAEQEGPPQFSILKSKPQLSKISAPQVISCSQPINAHKYLQDNRHWNFFKGIIPSVNSLDEDHILEFQSGVIALLQKLRESQRNQTLTKAGQVHVRYKGRGKKRKPACDVDYEWSLNETSHGKRKRMTKSNTDPIASENRESESESEYSTE